MLVWINLKTGKTFLRDEQQLWALVNEKLGKSWLRSKNKNKSIKNNKVRERKHHLPIQWTIIWKGMSPTKEGSYHAGMKLFTCNGRI